MPWSTTEICTGVALGAGGHHDPGAAVGVGDGVGDEVAHGGTDLLLGAEDLQPVLAARHHADLLGGGLDRAGVDRGGHDLVEVDHHRRLERVVALQAGELDDLLHEPGQAVALGQHAVGEALHRLGVVRGVGDGLGQQPDRADGGLELVADVGHEVAPHRLDPPLAGAVLDEGQHQPGAQGATRAVRVRSKPPSAAGRSMSFSRICPSRRTWATMSSSSGTRTVLPRTSPKAYAGAEALSTWSDSSTTTALERRTLSTAATPAWTTGSSTWGRVWRCRSLMCQASTAPPAMMAPTIAARRSLRRRIHAHIVRIAHPRDAVPDTGRRVFTRRSSSTYGRSLWAA